MLLFFFVPKIIFFFHVDMFVGHPSPPTLTPPIIASRHLHNHLLLTPPRVPARSLSSWFAGAIIIVTCIKVVGTTTGRQQLPTYRREEEARFDLATKTPATLPVCCRCCSLPNPPARLEAHFFDLVVILHLTLFDIYPIIVVYSQVKADGSQGQAWRRVDGGKCEGQGCC